MKIVVTGGAGFIGSELVHQLAASEHDIVAVDNYATGNRANLDSVIGGNVALAEADIRDESPMRPILRHAGIVFHLACLGVRHSIHSPRENHDVNATATLQLLILAREAGVGRFVHVSSSEVYGTARWAPMTEEHPTYPHTVYGASKLAGECYARAFHDTYGYPVVIVRPFNAYGPRSHHEGDSGEVIPKFLLRALAGKPMIVFGDGTQTRDFTYVSDTARAIREISSCDAAIGQTVNIGSGREIAINDLAEIVKRVAGGNASVEHDAPRPGDVHRLCADTSRMQSLCGYAPQVGFEEGLSRLKEWYLAGGADPEQLLAGESVRNWERA